ncbi:hypothetical protein ABPG74_008857 [Tetrahymena malaccensis]
MGCGQSLNQIKNDAQMTEAEKNRLENFTSKSNIRSVYQFSGVLGKGGFGTVKLAQLKSGISEKKVAVKIIEKSRLKDKQYALLRELEILKTLDHPNIIKFYEVYQDEMFFYICMEYCAGGELLERITSQKCFKEREASRIMEKVFSAINHMHSKGIVHRDLKPENILFLNKYNDSEIKLVDFGLSKKCDSSNQQLNTMVGTPLYVSPNVLKGKYDKTCDDWSAGVILYILLVGYPPFYGKSRSEIFKKIEKGVFSMDGPEWDLVSEDAKDLVKKMLVVDSKKRMTVDQALKHPWILKYQKKQSFTPSIVKSGSTTAQDLDFVDPKIINMLKNFRSPCKLRTEVMKVLVNQLNEKEIEDLKTAFRQIDKDQTGMIKVHELKDVMEKAGHKSSKEQIERIIRNISPCQETKDISIKYSEFIAATLDQIVYVKAEKIWSLFKYFDPSNTNYITIEDLKEIFLRNGRNIPDNEIKQMLKEVSPKTSGRITLEEFKKIMIGEELDIKS